MFEVGDFVFNNYSKNYHRFVWKVTKVQKRGLGSSLIFIKQILDLENPDQKLWEDIPEAAYDAAYLEKFDPVILRAKLENRIKIVEEFKKKNKL